ncbi:MAG: hypothetical protein QM504_15225 [Pseudomonadota bacterium]
MSMSMTNENEKSYWEIFEEDGENTLKNTLKKASEITPKIEYKIRTTVSFNNNSPIEKGNIVECNSEKDASELKKRYKKLITK